MIKSTTFIFLLFTLTISVKSEVTDDKIKESDFKLIREGAKAQYFLNKHYDHSSLDPKTIIKKASLSISPEEALLQADGLPDSVKKSRPFSEALEMMQDKQKLKLEPQEEELKLKSESKLDQKKIEERKEKAGLIKKNKTKEEVKKGENEKKVEVSKVDKKQKKKKSNHNVNAKDNHSADYQKRSKVGKSEIESRKSQESNKKFKQSHKRRSYKHKKHSRKSKDGKKNVKKAKNHKK